MLLVFALRCVGFVAFVFFAVLSLVGFLLCLVLLLVVSLPCILLLLVGFLPRVVFGFCVVISLVDLFVGMALAVLLA